MDWFPILIIIIVLIVLIIIITFALIFTFNGTLSGTNNSNCSTHNNCPQGYICISDATNNTSNCKAALGTSCNGDSDCVPDLICIAPEGSSSKVCSNKNPTSSEKSPKRGFFPRGIQGKHVTWAKDIQSHKNIPPKEDFKDPLQTTPINISPTGSVNILPTESTNIIQTETTNIPQQESIIIPQQEVIIIPQQESPNEDLGKKEINRSDGSCTPLSFDLPNGSIINDTSATPNISDIINPSNIHNISNSHDMNERSNKIEIARSSIKISTPDSLSRRPTRRIIVRRGSDSVTPITGLRTDVPVNTPVKTSVNTPVNTPINIIDQMQEVSVREKVRRVYSDDTSDDEINSNGDYTDAAFDVRSGESTDNKNFSQACNSASQDSSRNCGDIASVSTPCEEKDGVYYCRNDKSDIIQQMDIDHNHHSPVIDVCSYSNATIFLLEDGNIICEIKDPIYKRYRASNSIKLLRITSFNGYIYGVGTDNKLYNLPNSYLPTTNWIWNISEWAPINIKYISSTHDSSYLWIQTNDFGYLYNSPTALISKIQCNGMKRVYGRDVEHYIDIDPHNYSATIHPGDILVHNVYDGALSYYDEVVAIHPSERNDYRAITIVNWRPYYIRA